MRTRHLVAPTVLLVIAFVIGASAYAGGPMKPSVDDDPPLSDLDPADPVREDATANPGRMGVFHSQCAPDHRASDDPIMYPGQPGASHSHDFFGAVAIDAFSSDDALRGGQTTCRDSNDTAGYWVPTLYVDGRAVPAAFSNAYYAAGDKDRAAIKAFPPGLQMVAGGSKQSVTWSCRDHGKDIPRTTRNEFSPCQPDWETVAHVKFPDCWNGHDLTAPDGRAHMAYSEKNVCPTSHPVPVPSVNLHINYGKNLPAGNASLASGDPTTLHADFFNSWDQARLRKLIQYCIRESRNCGEAHTVA